MTARIKGSDVDPARAAALRVLCRCESEGTSLEDLIDALTTDAPDLDARDLRFVRQLCAGVTKWRLRLDWLLKPHSRRPLPALSVAVRQTLRLALYQLHWLDRVPARAAVHTAVELTKRVEHAGAAGYVNAVLRSVTRATAPPAYPDRQQDPAAFLSVFFSHPRWLVERWLARWGLAATEALMEANNRHPTLYVHRNPLRAGHDRFLAGLPAAAQVRRIDSTTYEVSPPEGLFDCRAFLEGHAYVQDLQAAGAVRLLAPAPGQRLLDLCAAPGGKAVQASISCADATAILACDRSTARLGRLRVTSRRLGLRSIRCLAAEAERLPLAHRHRFDRVLVDAPCSGTGVLRRHADARWHKRPGDLPRYARRQLRLLAAGFERLQPGGVLVYSTCSLEPEENEEVVETFLRRQPAACLEPAGDGSAPRFLQSLPGREEGDGAFAARMRKTASC